MNNNNTKFNKINKLLLFIDVIIICLSLISAWLIRSRFEFFYYGFQKFTILFPWVLLSRLFCHYFFGIYSFSNVSLNNRDLFRLIKYNLIPSIILLVMRLIEPIDDMLRMPFSMIAMEYIFTVIGYIFFRLFLNTLKLDKYSTEGYHRRVILWGEVRDLDVKVNMGKLLSEQNVEILGIINANPLYWNTEYRDIRIFGNEDEIVTLSAANKEISTLVFMNNFELTKRQKKKIFDQIKSLNMDFGLITNNVYETKSWAWFEKI